MISFDHLTVHKAKNCLITWIYKTIYLISLYKIMTNFDTKWKRGSYN